MCEAQSVDGLQLAAGLLIGSSSNDHRGLRIPSNRFIDHNIRRCGYGWHVELLQATRLEVHHTIPFAIGNACVITDGELFDGTISLAGLIGILQR